MKILTLPIFIARLAWHNWLNFVQLAVFHLSNSKLATANLLLTLAAIALGLAWVLLPYPQPIAPPKIQLAIESDSEIEPRYFTWDTAEVSQQFSQYQTRIAQQDFVSQAEYVNAAMLAHAAGKYKLAEEYLELARYIDPNRDFFVE